MNGALQLSLSISVTRGVFEQTLQCQSGVPPAAIDRPGRSLQQLSNLLLIHPLIAKSKTFRSSPASSLIAPFLLSDFIRFNFLGGLVVYRPGVDQGVCLPAIGCVAGCVTCTTGGSYSAQSTDWYCGTRGCSFTLHAAIKNLETESEMASKPNNHNPKETRLIKFTVSMEDHHLVRLAAALRRSSMAEFARQVVQQEARQLTEGIAIPHPDPRSG